MKDFLKKKNAVEIVSVVFFFFLKNYRYEFLRNKSAEAKQTEPSMLKKKKKKDSGRLFRGHFSPRASPSGLARGCYLSGLSSPPCAAQSSSHRR